MKTSTDMDVCCSILGQWRKLFIPVRTVTQIWTYTMITHCSVKTIARIKGVVHRKLRFHPLTTYPNVTVGFDIF